MEPAPSAMPHGLAPVGIVTPIRRPVVGSRRTTVASPKFETQMLPAAPRIPQGFPPARTRETAAPAVPKVGTASELRLGPTLPGAPGAACGVPQPTTRRATATKRSTLPIQFMT